MASSTSQSGIAPLSGLKVLELGGIGPGPHACMILGDLGADVVRVDPPTQAEPVTPAGPDHVLRNRRRLFLDLKNPYDRSELLALVNLADVLIEGFRPGVAERLGVGPAECHARNPRLVYGRMTGWGQTGPFANRAGHDINYISLTGALHAIGCAALAPPPPLNLVGDYGGGSMFLLVGVLAALLERDRSSLGQVVDAAMTDGVSVLLQPFWSLHRSGGWTDEREDNLLDGAAPFYGTYVCADGRYVAVGAIEPQFYAQLLQGLGVSAETLPDQLDRTEWPTLRRRFADVFATRSRDEWAEHFWHTDACVTPVLTFAEAPSHPHLRERGTHLVLDGVVQASPAPRFSRSQPPTPSPPSQTTTTSGEVFTCWFSTQNERLAIGVTSVDTGAQRPEHPSVEIGEQ